MDDEMISSDADGMADKTNSVEPKRTHEAASGRGAV